MSIRGITGDMNTGKSYLCEKIQYLALQQCKRVNVINCDEVRRYIITYSQEPIDMRVREQLARAFHGIRDMQGNIDRIKLGDIIFTDTYAMKQYEAIIMPRMRQLIIQQIQDAHDTYDMVLIEWAALIENNLHALVNNNILLTTCEEDIQAERGHGTDLPQQQLQNRYSYFWPADKKQSYIQRNANRFISFNTSKNPGTPSYRRLLDTLFY